MTLGPAVSRLGPPRYHALFANGNHFRTAPTELADTIASFLLYVDVPITEQREFSTPVRHRPGFCEIPDFQRWLWKRLYWFFPP